MTDFSHITPCGGDCSDCKHYIEKRCKGCLENGGKCVHMWKNGCEIFSCCTAHNAAFCGVCGEFPCQWLKNTLTWEKDGIERLAALGKEYRKEITMYRSKGLAMCGLACCLCAESGCAGCTAGDCTGKDWCEVRKCCAKKGISHCYECPETECRKGLLSKTKPRGFTAYARKYGAERLLDRLEENEKNGVVYHRSGFEGDYDGFQTEKELFDFIETGEKITENGKA